MPVQLINPEALPQPEFHAQVGVAQGSRIVFISGQVARDADGNPVGAGDLAAQAEQAFVNVHAAVTAAGGTFDDIAKLTIYLKDGSPELVGELGAGAGRAAARLGFDMVRPVTLLPVPRLFEPDLLIEVEAIAVLR